LMFASVALVSADPTQPHLSQAWTARSTGDGLTGETGNEAYLFGEKEAHHLWDYGAECVKLVTCPDSRQFCTAYYQNCDAARCCKCERTNEPKQWDIQGAPDGFFNRVNFVGYEDTTELNDNPIKGAEHWHQQSGIPKVVNVDYQFFVHRENNSDVVSHRIDFGTSTNASGSILYGGFAVQHDLDLHRQRFAVPDVCTGNIIPCGGCDDDGDAEIDAKWFKHAHTMRMVKKANSMLV